MKKKPPKNRKIQSATGSQFRMEKRTARGKGPERKKPLPPWRDVKDELKS